MRVSKIGIRKKPQYRFTNRFDEFSCKRWLEKDLTEPNLQNVGLT